MTLVYHTNHSRTPNFVISNNPNIFLILFMFPMCLKAANIEFNIAPEWDIFGWFQISLFSLIHIFNKIIKSGYPGGCGTPPSLGCSVLIYVLKNLIRRTVKLFSEISQIATWYFTDIFQNLQFEMFNKFEILVNATKR